MKILCIEKTDKSNIIKQLLNSVTLKENKIIMYSDKNKNKIVKKIKNILIKEKVDKVMVHSTIKKDKEFINLLHSNNIEIINDRWLFKMLTDDVIEKIIPYKKRAENEIWITLNDIDIISQNIIYKFAKEFKTVNIVTNHIRKFRNIEEKLYKEDGIMISISNNKRKSLLRANLILNIDFPKEVLNMFSLYDQAVIINIEGDITIKKKRFSGKIINDIEILSFNDKKVEDFIEENSLEEYDIKDICNVLDIVPKNLKFKFV